MKTTLTISALIAVALALAWIDGHDPARGRSIVPAPSPAGDCPGPSTARNPRMAFADVNSLHSIGGGIGR